MEDRYRLEGRMTVRNDDEDSMMEGEEEERKTEGGRNGDLKC
jgi:hypothetical protein